MLIIFCSLVAASLSLQGLLAQTTSSDDDRAESVAATESDEAIVHCANLVYADSMSSECYSVQFLLTIAQETNIHTHTGFDGVCLDSQELFDYPYTVMSGEGSFTLTDEQMKNLKDYLCSGGFLVASAECGSMPWNESFKQMMAEAFPDVSMVKLGADHPIFHSVYDITQSRYKVGGPRLPNLEALEIDGRVVLIWSPDGLNDASNAGPDCCCCGGDEMRSAMRLNVNILAYALTH